MRKTVLTVLSMLVVLSMVLSGCAQPTPTPVPPTAEPTKAPTTAAPAAAATTAPTAAPTEAPKAAQVKVGLVTDTGKIDDKSFNASAWKGLQDAIAKLGVDGKYLESKQQTDYAKNITEFLQQKVDMIVTVGYLLGEDTSKAAQANPNTKFAIVDFAYDPTIPNVLGLTFATDQAAFMAGYLAAGMTKTGKVATFGGMEIPTVTIFMAGYENGVKYYNQVHNTKVEVLGTKYYVGNFDSTDDGRRAAESLMDEGADIIMPVAGKVGLGAAAAVQERKGMLIGVDTDWFVSASEYKAIELTSVQKKIDVAVFEAVKEVTDKTFKGGIYVGTLKNNGVDLAPFHEFDSQVPQALKDELTQLKQDLIGGKVTTGWGEKPKETAATTEDTSKIIGEKVTISFWHTQAPDSARGKALDKIIKDFQAKYPEITVEATFQNDYTNNYKKILAAVAAKTPPDCAVSYPSMIADYLKADAVLALDDLMADPKLGLTADDLKDIYPNFLAEGQFPQYGNKYYAFPFTKSAEGMFYNLDLIKAAGFSAPPKTWKEFEEQCLAIAKMGKKGYAYIENASTFDSWLYSRGVKQLNADQTKAVFNSPEAIEALAQMKKLIDAGAVYKPEGQFADQAEFGKGNVAFTMGSTSGTPYYTDAVAKGGGNVKEWGQTIMPQSDASKPATVLYGGSFCIFKTTAAKQKAAWLFVKYFTSTEVTAAWSQVSGYMPVRASAAAALKDFFAKNPVQKEQFETIVPYGLPEPNVRGEQAIRTLIQDATTAAFEGVKTPKDALDEAVKKADDELAKGRQ